MAVARKAPIPFPLPDDLSGHKVGRFLVRHKLGSGGMGEVYYAEDTKLRRPVALKRVSSRLGNDPEARQHILHEAQRASALSSEHIANVHDVVEQDGEVLLVMEYVEGQTLRDRLQNQGRMTLDIFLPAALQCAEALAEAQRKKIVHRDIKPENIMLTPSGHIKILDFGLALHVASSDPNAVTASLESQVMNCAGTLGYMAPEVLLEQEPDSRADIFSLGVVFYEMLTGHHPFETNRLITTTDRILHEPPPPMAGMRKDVPLELERIVFKMLAKTLADRYATAADLWTDLRALQQARSEASLRRPRPGPNKILTRLGGALLAGAALSLVVFFSLSRTREFWGQPLPNEKNLAVLPFNSASADADARAFSQGLTETLTARLSQLRSRYPSLQVVPADEIRQYATPSLARLHADLKVSLVLTGSLHRAGKRLRISYNVVNAKNRRVLRAGTLTAEMDDPFALEDRVVESVVQALDMELGTDDRQRLATRGTNQPVAYDFYLRGRGYLQDYQKLENINSAIEVFQRALDHDPKFGLASAGLGESYWKKYELTHDPAWIEKALEACQRAAAGGLGRSCLGTIYDGTGKYEEAAAEFESVLEADPKDQDGYHGLAVAYEHLGKIAEAEQGYRKAIAARPEYWGGYSWLGAFYFGQARYSEAAGMFAQVVALAPDNARGYSNLCGAYIMAGRFSDAIPVCEQSAGKTPTEDAYSNLGTAYFYQRRFAEAAGAYERAVMLDDRQRSSWGNLGDAYYWDAGRRRDSASAYRRAIVLGEEELRVNPKSSHLLSYLAIYHAMLGEKSAASGNLNRALTVSSHDAEVLLNAALVANQLGDVKAAIGFLQQALGAGMSATLILSNPNFDNLSSNNKFQELVQERKPAGSRPQ